MSSDNSSSTSTLLFPRPMPITTAHGYTFQIVFTPNQTTTPNYVFGGDGAGNRQMCWFFGSVVYHRPGSAFDAHGPVGGFAEGETYNLIFTNAATYGAGWQGRLFVNGDHIASYAASTPDAWPDGGISRLHGFGSNYPFYGGMHFIAFHKYPLSNQRARRRSMLNGWQGLLEPARDYFRGVQFAAGAGGWFEKKTFNEWHVATQNIQEKSGIAFDDRSGERYFYTHNNAGQATIQRLDLEGANVGASFTLPAALGSNDIESIDFLGEDGFDYDDGSGTRTFRWAFLEEGEGAAPNDHPRIYLLEDMDSTTTSLDGADFATLELDDITTEASYGAEGLAHRRGTNEFYIVVQKVDSEGALWKVEVHDSPTAPTQTKIVDTDTYSTAGLISSAAFAGDLAIGQSWMGSSADSLFILFNDGQNSASGDTGRKILEVDLAGGFISTFTHSIEWQCEGLCFTDAIGGDEDDGVDFVLVQEQQRGASTNFAPSFWRFSTRSTTVLPWLSTGHKSDDDTDQYAASLAFHDLADDETGWDAFTGPGGDATITNMRDTYHEAFGSSFNTALDPTGRRTVYVRYYFEVTAAQLAACDDIRLAYIVDAGADVYLNGTNVLEYNCPATKNHAGRAPAAIGGQEEGNKHQSIVAKTALVAGTNRLDIGGFNEGGADVCQEWRVDLRSDEPSAGAVEITLGANVAAQASAALTPSKRIEVGANVAPQGSAALIVSRLLELGANVAPQASTVLSVSRLLELGASVAAQASADLVVSRRIQIGANVAPQGSAALEATGVITFSLGANVAAQASAFVQAIAGVAFTLGANAQVQASCSPIVSRLLELGANAAAQASAELGVSRRIQIGANVSPQAAADLVVSRLLELAANVSPQAGADLVVSRLLELGANAAPQAGADLVVSRLLELGANAAPQGSAAIAVARRIALGASVAPGGSLLFDVFEGAPGADIQFSIPSSASELVIPASSNELVVRKD